MRQLPIALAGLALSVLAACNSGGTPPPKTDAEKTAMATEIANLMTDPKMFDEMFGGTASAMMPAMSASCDIVPPAQVAACRERIAAAQPVIQEIIAETSVEARALMPGMIKDMSAIMAETYSGEELAKMRDFYGSPEGKSMVQKQPKVMAAYMPKVMERMQPMQTAMMRKMMERLGATQPPATPN